MLNASLVLCEKTGELLNRLRAVFRKFLKKQLDNYNDFLEYGKMKAWHDPDPTYKTAKPIEKEQLNVTEAYHLWGHINLRYDQIELTQLFYDFVHDESLRSLMTGTTL